MEFPSYVLWIVYDCHLMLGLSGAGVNGQRHDGLNKEIRSVPRNDLGSYYGKLPCSYRGWTLQGSGIWACSRTRFWVEECWEKMTHDHRSLS